jgi:hypothetical protein
VRNVDPQVMSLGLVRRSPHLLEELAMRDELSPMLGEDAQEIELDRGQMDLLAADAHGP